VQPELRQRLGHVGGLHVVAPAGERSDPADRRADEHRDEAARQAARKPHVRGPRDQHDREARQADPGRLPHLERRAHRDERDRDAGQGAEHRRARGECAQLRADECAEQDDDADDEAPREPADPRDHRVLCLEVDREHHQEDDDEHVRHARPVRHRGDVAAAFLLAELPREVRVEEVAERQRDAERRQDAAEHGVGGKLDDAEAQPRQHDHVQQHVGEQAEEAVQVARHPQARHVCGGGLCVHRLPPRGF
jgi:hypothetical protein